MKNKIDLNKVNPLTLVLITVIVLILGVLLGRSLLPILNVNNGEVEVVGPQLDVVTNISQRDRFAGYKITIPAGWNISYTLASTANSEWMCLEGENCQVMVITHDEDTAQLKRVVLATPVAARYAVIMDVSPGTQTLIVGGQEIKMTTEKYMTASDTGSVASNLILQTYGCTAELLCLNVGPFSEDPQVNLLQSIEFNSFAQQVKFEKI